MSSIDVLGFGECPHRGPFMLDGHCEVVGPTEMIEKEGLKVENQIGPAQSTEPMFMKLKIARVVLYKKHYDFSLREIIERKRAISMEQ